MAPTTEASATVPETPESMDTPYHALSRILTFPNLDQHQYWHHLAPMFGKMLADAKYSIHRQYEYLLLYARIMIPKFGPFRLPGTEEGVFRNILGSVGPYEVSNNLQKSGKIVRIGLEPTSYMACTGHDPFNRRALHSTLAELKEIGSGGDNVDLELHHRLINELTITDREQQLIPAEDIAKMPWHTQVLVGMDLYHTSGFVVKEYFYPSVKASVTGQTVENLCFSAIRKVDPQGHFDAAARIVESYLQRQPKLETFMFACDLVDLAKTRFKLYVMELDVSFRKIEEHFTLGGALRDEETMVGLQMIREIWDGLEIPEGQRPVPTRSTGPAKPGDPLIHPIGLYYQLNPGDPVPKVQFYFPLVGIPDAKIADVLVAFFERHGMTEHAKTYKENLQSY